MKAKRPVQEIYYEEFRASYVMIGVTLVITCIILGNAWLAGLKVVHFVLMLGLMVVLALFFGVKIVTDGETLCVSYGVGLISFVVTNADLASYRIPPNRYLRTWLYSPLNAYALELHFRGGGRLLVPARDPKGLATMLRVKP